MESLLSSSVVQHTGWLEDKGVHFSLVLLPFVTKK